jgi:hypothetical protein
MAATARRPVFPDAPVTKIGFVRSIIHSGRPARPAGGSAIARRGLVLRRERKETRGHWRLIARFPSQVSHAAPDEFRGLVNVGISAYATALNVVGVKSSHGEQEIEYAI